MFSYFYGGVVPDIIYNIDMLNCNVLLLLFLWCQTHRYVAMTILVIKAYTEFSLLKTHTYIYILPTDSSSATSMSTLSSNRCPVSTLEEEEQG